MRTKEEVQKMLGKALNATPFMPDNNKEQKARITKLYCFNQVLSWVLQDDDKLTKRLEERINRLKN